MLYILAVQLGVLFSLGKAKCVVTHQASSEELVLKGTVLSPKGPIPNGCVHIQQGTIVEVAQRCKSIAKATMVDCGTSVISPGFINSHEHTMYSLVSPFPDNGERYGSRNEWRMGIGNHTILSAECAPDAETNATAWGELRHLFSGTTSIIGGDYVPGLTRNLDYVKGLEKGLQAPVNTWSVFPLDDEAGILQRDNCNYGPDPITQETAGKDFRYFAHIGEGVDAQSQNEFRCLSNETFDTTARSDGSGVSIDIVAPNLVLVQATSLTEQNFDLIAKRGAQVVWSPRSNVRLYGKTLNVTYLLDAGITVALGTDWLPSGSATMSREATCASHAMKTIYDIDIAPKSLWEMMTLNAAKVVGFEHQLGSLEPGKLADITVWGGKQSKDPYAQAIYTPTEDIELVMRGEDVLLASESLHKLTAKGCENVSFGKTQKIVCVENELNSTFADFQAVLKNVYPAILPGLPPHEPSCEYIP